MRQLLARLAEPFVYYGAVVWRALRDSGRHFMAQIAAGLVLLVLGTVIKCAIRPPRTPCDMSDFRTGMLAVLLYFSATFAFNLIMGPVRLHREQHAAFLEVARREPPPREFVEVTPEELAAYFAGRTTDEAQRML